MRKKLSALLNLDILAKGFAKDLKRLDALEHGLGDKAVQYVQKGQSETVLSTLANVDTTKSAAYVESRVDPCS